MDIKIPGNGIPGYVDKVLGKLSSAGFEAYIVGGCVRDILMGEKPNDFDVTTNAVPDEICACFKGYKTIEVGKKYGTVIVLSGGRPVEVTTYRIDGEYMDSRHPEKVKFTRSLEEDLARRDFTINAVAYSCAQGMVDPFGGAEAIKKKKIACVGNPVRRFEEDALRILRALRFSSVLGFTIDEETVKAMYLCSRRLSKISAERINKELCKLVMGKNADEVLVKYGNLLAEGVPGFRAAPVQDLPFNAAYRLAALFPEHTKEYLKELRFDNETQSLAEKIAELRDKTLPEDETGICKILKSFGPEATALYFEAKGKREIFEEVLRKGPCFRLKDLAVTGKDLMENGMEEGPWIGEALDLLLNKVIEKKVANKREDLLAFLRVRQTKNL